MYKLGGCWVDTDVCCIKIEIPTEKVAGELHRDENHASTQFLHFEAGNSMMKDFMITATP